MRKILLFLVIAALTLPCLAKSTTSVPTIEGDILHSIQSAWLIADSTTAAGTEPSALGDDERTKLLVDAAILAASSGDDEISLFPIPSKWNGIRFRALSTDNDTGTATHQIYFGTLGGDLDCSLTYSAQLAWTAGDQDSIYHQITFTSGGAASATAYVPQPGDTVTGNSSGETAVIISITLTSDTWTAGTAAGTITYRSKSGTFTSSETVAIARGNVVLTNNAYTHAASDLVQFEYMDTLVLTSKSWTQSWTSNSPADDTNAEARIDAMGADLMVVVTSACSDNDDCKLLVTGY